MLDFLSPLVQNEMAQIGMIVAAWLLAGIFVAAWVHQDAQRRKAKVTLWATIGFFLNLPGLILYLIARPSKPKLVCPQCGREMLPSWDSCPFCNPQTAQANAVEIEPITAEIRPQTQETSEESEPAPSTTETRGKTVKLQTVEPVLAWLIVKKGKRVGKEFRLRPDITSIGADVSNDIVLEDEAISRHHAKVRIEDDRFMLYDLVSTNGTFVNEEQVAQHELQDGDEVRFGSTILVFKKI